MHIKAVNIPKVWEVIKHTAVKTDNIQEKNFPVYLTNLLQDLLSGYKQCLIGYDDKFEIISCLIYSIKIEPTTGISYVMLDNLYAFQKQSMEHWQLMWDDMTKIAKKNNCDVIACNTTNPRIEEMFTYYGATLFTKTYYKYV